jgi:hypothetical protein
VPSDRGEVRVGEIIRIGAIDDGAIAERKNGIGDTRTMANIAAHRSETADIVGSVVIIIATEIVTAGLFASSSNFAGSLKRMGTLIVRVPIF